MLKLNHLLLNYLNQREKRERKVGRYHASELWAILTGRFQPEDFRKEQKYDLKSCRNIIEGELRELALKQLLDFSKIKYEYQVKKVLKVKDFEIVAVSDFLFEDMVLECKSPTTMTGIKEWNKPQLEAQYRMFKKPVYIMYLKERFENKTYNYVPNEKLWNEILNKVSEFHKKLCLLQLKKKELDVKEKSKKH